MRRLLLLLPLAACRDPAPPVSDAGTPAAPVTSTVAHPARIDAGGFEPKLPLDPTCDGPLLDLLTVVMDSRCAVTTGEWNDLAANGRGDAGVRLVQEAEEGGLDGDSGAARDALAMPQTLPRDAIRIAFFLANRGASAVLVPLRVDHLAAERVFTAIAQVEGDASGLFALPPPTVVRPPGHAARFADALGVDAGAHVQNARVRLPPGGRLRVQLAIELRAAERLDRRGDGGLLPLRRPLTLHVGQAFSPLEAGDPARVVLP